MGLPRYRRARSRSKDRESSRGSGRSFRHGERSGSGGGGGAIAITKTSVLAFVGGALIVVALWARLQAPGVRGPWARVVEPKASAEDDSLEWLRLRKQYLLGQLALADSKLAPLVGSDHNGHNRRRPGYPSDMDGKGRLNSEGDAFPAARSSATPSAAAVAAAAAAAGGGRQGEPGLVGGAGDGHAAQGEGVEATGHFILGLSTEAFGSTPVNEMMDRYDTKNCDASFGNGLVNAWRRTETECCGGFGSSPSSSIRCHLMQQDHHHGNGDNLVHMTNVQLDLGDWSNPTIARRIMQAYKDSKHAKQAYVDVRPGAIKGTCTPAKQSGWKEENFPGWNADWTARGFQSVDRLECDRWVDHPVLVIQRDTFANLFHNSEDFVNAFLAMAILKKEPRDVQVLLTDLYPRGPFWAMWDKVFGAGRPTLTAWDVGQQYGEGKVCFRDLTVGIFGPAAPTTLARLVTPCFHTALVRAYADFVIRGLGLQQMTSYASPPSKKVVVTWMARRSSVQWPERAFCSEDGRGSFFTCDYFEHLDIRPLQRKVKNEGDVVRSLKQLERETFPNGAVVEVRDLDYNLLSFEDQIKNDLETDVMIGPHGAGLFHIIFTADRASLIELQIDQTTARKHFNNLAKWSGHGYTAKGGPNPVSVEGTQAMVRQAISEMDLSAH